MWSWAIRERDRSPFIQSCELCGYWQSLYLAASLWWEVQTHVCVCPCCDPSATLTFQPWQDSVLPANPNSASVVPWLQLRASGASCCCSNTSAALGTALPRRHRADAAGANCPRKQGSPGLLGRMVNGQRWTASGWDHWGWRRSLARPIPRRWSDRDAAEQSLPLGVLGRTVSAGGISWREEGTVGKYLC